MASQQYSLDEIKNGNGNVHTHDLPDHELGNDAPKSHISLTKIDESDMYRLGKKQELNVCNNLEIPALITDTASATSASSRLWDSPWFSWAHGKGN